LWEQILHLHYSLRTEAAYAYWVKSSVMLMRKKYQRDMRRQQEAALAAMA
jgi:hypothetical protein